MHISEVEKMRLEKEHKMRYGHDYDVKSNEAIQRKGFADHDGSYEGHNVNIKVGRPESNDKMPQIDSLDSSSEMKPKQT